jgi:predicted Kef-type K+ transport protein
MLFAIGAFLYIVGWVVCRVVYNPYSADFTPSEAAAVISVILGVVLMLASVGILAWNYLP